MSELPQADSADTDAVQMALQAAHTLWSRGDTTESLRWLKRAAESASDEGADLRSLQLAKAAAELRAKLFPTPSDAPPSLPARVPTQFLPERDLSGIRPAAEALAREAEVAAVSGGARSVGSELEGRGRLEDSPPSSRSPSSSPQYVVHRPREAQRQLMGLSSSTLETARQHNGASYPSVPSWSAGSERRTSSPPPLPPRSLDDYEELDAEPVEDSDTHARAWAATAAPTWRPADRQAAERDAAQWEERRQWEDRRREDSSPRIATLPPPSFQPSLSSNPPPLPELSAFEDEHDAMRAEQPTQVIPPREERTSDAEQMLAAMSLPNSSAEGPRPPGARADAAWEANGRAASWDSGVHGWAGEGRAAAWAGSSASPSVAEPAPQATDAVPAKLTARVHHQAVRVSFAPDSRAPGQYVVRPLREGERPPAGERVALLVALEPGVPLV
ncbi:MAG TPA: hypothetical protein VFS67_34510 [Polyangiaceae bacterium]|jgi:hypothetical protein|nr:hypothetical protein [Polyangiaceae bacterium]